MDKSNEILRVSLLDFTGTTRYYTASYLDFKYTDGIAFLIRQENLEWLIMDIGYFCLQHREGIKTISIKLTYTPKEGLQLVFKDAATGSVLMDKSYRVAVFPYDCVDFCFVNNTLMLISEY